MLRQGWFEEQEFSENSTPLLKRSEAYLEKDLTKVHPLFEKSESWDWHRAYGGEKSHWDRGLRRDSPISGESAPGDVRLSWEKSRHQFLLAFYWSWRKTQDVVWLQRAFEIIDNWSHENPFPNGIHWRDAQEVGLRAKVWLRIFMDGAKEPSLQHKVEQYLPSLILHGRYVENFTSFNPDTHNHLLTELCARLHFRYVFNKSPAPIKTQVLETLLLREIHKQFWKDGSPGEGSVNYHFFVLESLYELFLHAEVASPTFASQLKSQLKPIIEFALSILGPDGDWPIIGDADGGLGTGLFPLQQCLDRRPLAAALRRDWSLKDTGKESQFFPGLGMGIFRCDKTQSILYAMVGPDTPRPAVHRSHHHADRLSFVLTRRGRALLADPGTFSYNGSMAERVRDRETSSHNAPGFAGKNQMDVTTARFGVGILPVRHHTLFQDSHTPGVSVLNASIPMAQATVNRMWVWCPDDDLLAIRDTWTGADKEEAEVWFHGGEFLQFTGGSSHTMRLEMSESQEPLLTLTTWDPEQGQIHLPSPTNSKMTPSPIPSTVSPRYGCKKPSESVRVALKNHRETSCLLTLVSLSGKDLAPTWTPSALSWTTGEPNARVWTYTAHGDFTRDGVSILPTGISDS